MPEDNNQLDNIIRHRQPSDDELIDLLNATRPIGKNAHQISLEAELLRVLETQLSFPNDERHTNIMIIQGLPLNKHATSPTLRVPLIAVAALLMVISFGIVMAFSNGPSPQSGGATAGRNTPTTVPSLADSAFCAPHYIRQLVALEPITVYANDDLESKALDTFEADQIVDVFGRNFEGDWLVIDWREDQVGWIELNRDAFEIVECLATIEGHNDGHDPSMLPTVVPPNGTALPPTAPPPDGTFPLTCENHEASIVILNSAISLYADDDGESPVLGELEEDQAITILGQNKDGSWLVVKWDGSTVG